jgi:Ca2+-binding EF-hand superfamily protein
VSKGKVPKKKSNVVIDSRYLKIVAAKKDELKDALIFVSLDEEKYGYLDKAQLRKIIQTLEKVAPDSVWFGFTKDYSVSIIDRAELKNKHLLVTIRYEDMDIVDEDATEEMFRKAIPEAASLTFIHTEDDSDIEEKP